jgi:hypothetical protein
MVHRLKLRRPTKSYLDLPAPRCRPTNLLRFKIPNEARGEDWGKGDDRQESDMIFGTKDDDSYVIEFTTGGGCAGDLDSEGRATGRQSS